jgi:hypothetical protein
VTEHCKLVQFGLTPISGKSLSLHLPTNGRASWNDKTTHPASSCQYQLDIVNILSAHQLTTTPAKHHTMKLNAILFALVCLGLLALALAHDGPVLTVPMQPTNTPTNQLTPDL